MRAERKRGDKPEETAGKKRRMDRLSRMVKKPQQLAVVTAMVLVLAAALCACTSTGAGGEGKTPAPPEGVSTPPAVSAEPSPAPTESVTEPEPSQQEPISTPELEPSQEPDTAGGDFQAEVRGENVPYDQWRQSFESEEAFLAAFGFADAQPSCRYSHTDETWISSGAENELISKTVNWEMRIYYNEETGAGCAVRAFTEMEKEQEPGEDATAQDGESAYGYALMETQLVAEDDWEQWDRWKTDWFTIPHREWVEVEDYQERYDYDENGRLSTFSADGICPSPWTNEDGRNPIYAARFTYRENGTLQYRGFSKFLEGSYQMNQRSWFDELGRVCYETCYITHGEEEFLYFYDGDSPAPAYCLYLDIGGGGVIFGKY